MCRRTVLWVKYGRQIVALDTCAAGEGDIAIQTGLLGFDPPAEPEAIEVLTGTCYRKHRCSNAAARSQLAHTAAASEKKRR